MVNYNQEKLKKFHEYTLQDYEGSLIVDKIVDMHLVEKTDGSFIQIGIRPLIEEDIFIDPGFSEYLPGAGRTVAIGEEEFLISKILENKEIERRDFKENLKEFPKKVYEIDNAVILLSTKFYVEFFTNLMNRIDYEENIPRLDKRFKIISISERILGNKIIILDRNAILWEKEIFEDKTTGTAETLDISIKTIPGGKVDITLRSVNKITIVNPELIKILQVKDEK